MVVDADPPVDETSPSLDEVRETLARLNIGKVAGVWYTNGELLSAGVAVILGLHADLTEVWQSGTVLFDGKKGMVFPMWEWKGNHHDGKNYAVLHRSVCFCMGQP